MAETKKKKNKFVKVFACILFVVLVVGGVLLFIPTDKSSLVGELAVAKESMLLQDSQSKSDFDAFFNRVRANDRVRMYGSEISAVKKLADNMDEVVDYYNYYIKFAQSNRTYKNNNGKAKSSLQKATSKGRELNSIISNAIKLTNSTETYLRSTWVKYRSEFLSYLSYCEEAFGALSKILCGCFGETITINGGTKANVLAVNDYLNVINQRVAEVIKNDKVAQNASSYDFNYGGVVNKFSAFVDKYIKEFGNEQKYFFDSSVQEGYQSVIAYLENDNFQSIILTIDKNGNFIAENKTPEILAIENYLGGN